MATILVAEDEPSIRTLIEVNLEMEGYDVVVVEDGEEAVAAARSHRPDLILMDGMMPRMDGWSAKKILDEDPDLSRIPVIFLSARAQKADVQKGLEAGAVEYVIKPFEPEHLLRVVAQVLAGGYQREEPE